MDFVGGLDAARLLTDRYPAGCRLRKLPVSSRRSPAALDYAYKQGLLHRDVKPPNIILTHLDNDGEQRIPLTDFGIARNINEISGLTKTNMTVGTIAYSAPEQLLGEDMDGRADQYSLVATTYHLLTGSLAFPSSNPAVVISRHLNVPPPALATTRHQAIIRDVIAAGDFWGGAGSVACQQFITELGRNFQVIYEKANAYGAKVQTAGSNMASTDSAVGSSWA
jgi:serine/threonine protein kinase